MMKLAHNIMVLVVFAFFVLSMSGCSYLYTVQGRITFEDGTPLETGTIYFEQESVVAKGCIDKSGHYSVNGVQRGENKIYILGVVNTSHAKDSILDKDSDLESDLVWLVDDKLRYPETSNISCFVDKNMKFNIVVAKPSVKTVSLSKSFEPSRR